MILDLFRPRFAFHGVRLGLLAWFRISALVLAGSLAAAQNAGAQTWKLIGNLPPWVDMRCAYFWDTANGVVGGVGHLYRYNSGAWRECFYPEAPATFKSLRLLDGFDLFAASGATCLWETNDRGVTWQKTANLLPNADDFYIGRDGIIHGMNLNGTGMMRGTSTAKLKPTSNFYIDVFARDDDNMVYVDSPKGSGFTGNFVNGYNCAVDTCLENAYIISDGDTSGLYISRDDAQTWVQEYLFGKSGSDVMAGGPFGVLYVQGPQNIWRSISSGVTWENIGGPGFNLADRRMFSFGDNGRYLIVMDSNNVWLWDGGTNYIPAGPMTPILTVSNIIDTNCTLPSVTVHLNLTSLTDTVRLHTFTLDGSTIQPSDTLLILPPGSGSMPVQFRTSVPYQQFTTQFYFQDTISGVYSCGEFRYTEDTAINVQMPTHATALLSASDLTDTGCSLSQLTVYLARSKDLDTVYLHAWTNDGLVVEPADTMVIVTPGVGQVPISFHATMHPFQFASTFYFADSVSGWYKCGHYSLLESDSILVHMYPPPKPMFSSIPGRLKFDACSPLRIPLAIKAPATCDSLTIDSITWLNTPLVISFDHEPPETLGPAGIDTFWVTISAPAPGTYLEYFYLHTMSTVAPHPFDTSLYLSATVSTSPGIPVSAQSVITRSNCASSNIPIYLRALSCDSVKFTSCFVKMTSAVQFQNSISFPLLLTPASEDTMNISIPPQGFSGPSVLTAEVKGNYMGSNIAFDTTVQIRINFTNAATALASDPDEIEFNTNPCGEGEVDTFARFTNFGCDTITITGDVTQWQPGWSDSDPSFPFLLAPDSSFSTRITFVPASPAYVNQTVSYAFEYEGGKKGSASLSVAGEVAPAVTSFALNDTSFDLGTVSQCALQAFDTSLIITNLGCDSLALSNASVAGTGFTLVSGGDTELAPNQSAMYRIHFSDSVPNAYSCLFHITGIGAQGGNRIDTTVSLAATIVPGTQSAAIDRTAIDFGTTSICEERDTSITIANTGCEPDTIFGGTFSSLQFAFDTSVHFPIIVAKDSSVSLRIETHLDTTGRPSPITGTLVFSAGPVISLPSVSLSREVNYPGTFSLSISSEPSAPVKSMVPFYVTRKGTIPGSASEVDFDVIYDDNLLGFNGLSQPDIQPKPPVILSNGLTDRTFQMLPATDRDTIATLEFESYLTKNLSTNLTLERPQFISGGEVSPECVAMVDTTSTNSNFTLQLSCQDSLILAAWNGTEPFSIESIVPNPASASLRVEGIGDRVWAELEDILGRVAIPYTLYPIPFTLDISMLPDGIYYLRMSEAGYVQTRKVEIER